jgi:hypothetical protein
MKLKSFNVVEYTDNNLLAVHSFDNQKEAEECFIKVAEVQRLR